MPEDKACKLLLPPRSCDNRKQKKKKRKKSAASSTSPQNAEKPQTVLMPPETSTVSLLASQGLDEDTGSKLRASSKKDGERFAGSGQRTKKNSRAPLSGAPSQGYMTELSAKESLRWEGVLEDPQAEEKRLELYRANRRRRYIAHREALLKETRDGLKQTCLKKSREIKALTEADQQLWIRGRHSATGGSACSFKLLDTDVGFNTSAGSKQSLEVEEYQHIFSSQLADGNMGSLYLEPVMVEELTSSHSLISHCLVSVSTGYFIYDFLDIVPVPETVLGAAAPSLCGDLCFALPGISRLYVGFAVVSLLVEINSVFLHMRQLLLLSGRGNRPRTETSGPGRSATYSVTSRLNVGAFVVFRVCTLAWMTLRLAGHSEHVPRYILMMGTAGLHSEK